MKTIDDYYKEVLEENEFSIWKNPILRKSSNDNFKDEYFHVEIESAAFVYIPLSVRLYKVEFLNGVHLCFCVNK